MKVRFARLLVFAAGVSTIACVPQAVVPNVLVLDAQGEELRKETVIGASLPPGCPTLTHTILPGKSSFRASYTEPTHRTDGTPLNDLAYTTLYVSSANLPTRAIRIWARDANGGKSVIIEDIPTLDLGTEIGLCVTATNWANQESLPADR